MKIYPLILSVMIILVSMMYVSDRKEIAGCMGTGEEGTGGIGWSNP
jgi:hypothetical protein